MLLMSSAGYIYSQDMDDDSSAKHGPFYVTNTMEVVHPEIKVLIINFHLYNVQLCLLSLNILKLFLYSTC